jgi:hypothetical protein
MKLFGGCLAFALVFSFLVSAALALPTPNVEFIPDMISENGSFLMIVDPMVHDKSIRVTWKVPGFLDTNIGLLPREGDKWICYFSNDDKDATCGPTPFSASWDQYDILIESVDSGGETGNKSFDNFEVGAIKLTPQLTPFGGSVDMIVFPSGGLPKEVLYAVYDSSFKKKIDYTLLSRDPATGYFTGRANLGVPGTYYFAFKTDDQSASFGGGLIRQDVGVGTGLISGSVEADPVILNLLLNKTQVYRNINNQIKNIGSKNLTGLSVVVDSKIANMVSIQLEKKTLRAGESGYFTVKLENVNNRIDVATFANVTSNGSVVGQIFLNLNISVLGECTSTACPICPTAGQGRFTFSDTVWQEDYLVGATPKMDFVITNNGDSDLTVDIPNTGTLGSSASITTDEIIPAGGTGTLSIELSPVFAGTYSGIITVTTSDGSQNIIVNTNFYNDISDDIVTAKTELDLLLSSDIDSLTLTELDAELTQAEDDLNFGDYKSASEGYATAAAKVALLTDLVSSGFTPPSNGGGSGDGDSTGIIIILVIVLVVLVGVFVYLKKFKGASGGGFGGSDEDIEEELGADEEGY